MSDLVVRSDQADPLDDLAKFNFNLTAKENDIASEKDRIIADFLKGITAKRINDELDAALKQGGRSVSFTYPKEVDGVRFYVDDYFRNSHVRAFICALRNNPSVAEVFSYDTLLIKFRDFEYERRQAEREKEYEREKAENERKEAELISQKRTGIIGRFLSIFEKKPDVPALPMPKEEPAPKPENIFLSRLADGVSKIEKLAAGIDGLQLDTQPIKTSIEHIKFVMEERFVSRTPLHGAVHDLETMGNVIDEYVRVARAGDETKQKVTLKDDDKVKIDQLFKTLTMEFGQTAAKALEPLELSANISADVLQESMQRRLVIK